MLGRLYSIKAVVVFPVIISLLICAFVVESATYMDGLWSIGYSGTIGPASDVKDIPVELEGGSGYLSENSEIEFSFEAVYEADSFYVTLEWVDEANQQFLENQPDQFRIRVISPEGDEMASHFSSNSVGVPGRLEYSARLEGAGDLGAGQQGTWTVIIEAGDCGDHTSLLRTVADGGNDYSFEVSYSYVESYYKETWLSWRGIVQTTVGLISIMVGLFLLHVSSKKKNIAEMIEGDCFPIFIAGLLFLINGLALFADGSSGFLWDRTYYLWGAFFGVPLYTLTYPLLPIFPLYYPRTLFKRLDPLKTRSVIISTAFLVMIVFWVIHAAWPDWLYYWTGYVCDNGGIVWTLMDGIYFTGIIMCLVIFTYWYRFKEIGRMEKNALAFIIAGFIFTPLNQWDEFGSAAFLRVLGRNIEATVATVIALFLVGTGLLLMYREKKLIKREAFLISIILISWLFFFVLNDLVAWGLEGYAMGFSLVRPICFTIAILQFKLFNINITQRVLLYTSLSLLIGIVFFAVKNGFQAALPQLGFLSILLVTALFLPLSAFTNYFSERLAPKLTGLLRLSRDTGPDGGPVAEEKPSPLSEHFRTLLRPRALIAILSFGIFIEILENALNDAIGYPGFLSIIYVGILFSALDYLVESNILGGNDTLDEPQDDTPSV